MTITETFISDLYLISYPGFHDNRGEFIKTIHSGTFENAGLDYEFKESYYSVSHKDVIRGMHFQIPPDDHCKLVHVLTGSILDIVLDIRTSSPTFGKYFQIELNSEKKEALYIGKGLAHGFLSLINDTIVEYHTTTPHSVLNEKGIHYNSFGFKWEIDRPVLSERDLNQPLFLEFKNPF